MKISKHVHSCLLIEEAGKVFLIDPGNYTVSENALDLSSIPQLDYLLITHEHQDHTDLSLIKEIFAKFPEVKIFSNSSVAVILEKEGIKVGTSGNELVTLETVPHEKIFMSNTLAKNVMFTIAGKFSHPGDSHHFETSSAILALPVQAPWGSTTAAVELAVKLKPKVIIPIHDWHWNEKARKSIYQRLEEYFRSLGIRFIGLETNEVVEV